MRTIITIAILTIISATCCFSQTAKDTVDKIILADTIYFDVLNGGCFERFNENIVIIKISKDNYSVRYTNDDALLINTTTTLKALHEFSKLYKSKMTKKYDCWSTSYYAFTLKAKHGLVEFEYNGCKYKDNPSNKLKELLNISTPNY